MKLPTHFPLFGVLFSTACTSTPEVDPCDDLATYTPSVTLGTGSSEFVSFEEGELLTPAYGPQGGHHIWVSFEATGINPGNGQMIPDPAYADIDGGTIPSIPDGDDPVTIQTVVRFPNHELGPHDAAFVTFLKGDFDLSSLPGITAFVDVYTAVAELPDEESIPAEVSLSVTDSCGTLVEDTRAFEMQLADVDGFYDYATDSQ